MRPADFDALAERILHSILRANTGYTPPDNAHMLTDTAIRMADEFLHGLKVRHEDRLGDGFLTPEERELARGGNKIRTIKLVRERTGMMLKDAKDYVDKALDAEPKSGPGEV